MGNGMKLRNALLAWQNRRLKISLIHSILMRVSHCQIMPNLMDTEQHRARNRNRRWLNWSSMQQTVNSAATGSCEPQPKKCHLNPARMVMAGYVHPIMEESSREMWIKALGWVDAIVRIS